jgi:hypothetical protein
MCGSARAKLILLSVIVSVALVSVRGYADEANTAQPQADQGPKVYKSVGPDGEVIYSDKPSADSKKVTVPSGESYKPVPPPTSFTPYQAPAKAAAKMPIDNHVTITSPTNEQSIWSGPGEVQVSVSLESGLGPGQTLEYLLDGKTVYTGTATSHSFKNVFRGAHVLTVRIKSESGDSVASQPVTFYMKRPFKKK